MDKLLSCIQDSPNDGIWKKIIWSAEREKLNEATVSSIDRSLMVIIETLKRLGKLPDEIEIRQTSDGVFFRLAHQANGWLAEMPLSEAEPVILPVQSSS